VNQRGLSDQGGVFEGGWCVHRLHLLAISATISLGPFCLARITFHLEVFVALGSAEGENLRVGQGDLSLFVS